MNIFFHINPFQPSAYIASIAFIKLDDRVYEVGKMAVIPEYQGKGIGQRILQYGLSFGQKQGWKLLVIYSCLCLENALHIYKKFGFTEVELEKENPYARVDVKLELQL